MNITLSEAHDVAKRRGVMVIAAVQLRRLGALSEGIRVYSPEGGDA